MNTEKVIEIIYVLLVAGGLFYLLKDAYDTLFKK